MLRTGFVYLWHNEKSDMKYIGSHVGDVDDGYVGSGKLFIDDYDKDPTSFKRTILLKIESDNIVKDIRIEEEKFLIDVDAANSDDYYNLTNCANGFGWADFWENLSSEQYNRISSDISNSAKAYWENLSKEDRYFRLKPLRDYWKNLTDEERLKISQLRKDYWKNLTETEYANFIQKCKDNWAPPADYETWYNNVNMKKLKECYQFDKDGNFIQKFDSLEAACNEFNNNSKSGLSLACRGKQNYWNGYRWSYTNSPNELIALKKVGRKKGSLDTKPRKKKKTTTANTYLVHKVDEKGNILKTFDSPTDCANKENISRAMLIHYLNGRCGNTYKGKIYIKGDRVTIIKNNY